MIKKFSYRHIDWIDLEEPSPQDIEEAKDKYNFHPITAQELSSPSLKPRIDFFDDHVYLVLFFPIYDAQERKIYTREIDFIIGKHYIITAHYEEIKELHQFGNIFEYEKILEQHDPKVHAGFLFYYIVRHLYASLENEINLIDKSLQEIEDKVFSGDEHKMVQELSVMGRSLLDFKRAIKEHEGVLISFKENAYTLYGDTYKYYSSSIFNEYKKLWNESESVTDILKELRDTNDSLLSTKINDIMKFLTIMAFVTFPLSLMAGIFGMNTLNTPIVGSTYDFWIIIGTMFTITLVFFIFFKYKRWL